MADRRFDIRMHIAGDDALARIFRFLHEARELAEGHPGVQLRYFQERGPRYSRKQAERFTRESSGRR